MIIGTIMAVFMLVVARHYNSFNSAIGAFQTLRARHGPNYVICGGDFNVQLSR